MSRTVILMCLAAIPSALWAGGQELYEKETFTHDGKKLLYRVLKPAKIDKGKNYPLVRLDISSASHPFFTGKMKFVDTTGRVEKFTKKYNWTGRGKTADAPAEAAK